MILRSQYHKAMVKSTSPRLTFVAQCVRELQAACTLSGAVIHAESQGHRPTVAGNPWIARHQSEGLLRHGDSDRS